MIKGVEGAWSLCAPPQALYPVHPGLGLLTLANVSHTWEQPDKQANGTELDSGTPGCLVTTEPSQTSDRKMEFSYKIVAVTVAKLRDYNKNHLSCTHLRGKLCGM